MLIADQVKVSKAYVSWQAMSEHAGLARRLSSQAAIVPMRAWPRKQRSAHILGHILELAVHERFVFCGSGLGQRLHNCELASPAIARVAAKLRHNKTDFRPVKTFAPSTRAARSDRG